MSEPPLREPAFDIDFAGNPDTPWNRLALGWLGEPEYPPTEAHLTAVLFAEAVVAAEFYRWLGLDS